MATSTGVTYKCRHPEIVNDHTAILTRAGRQVQILIDNHGNARQYNDHPDGYQVATRRIDDDIATILLDAGWEVVPWAADADTGDDISMLSGKDGAIGMAFRTRAALDPSARQEQMQAQIDALRLQLSEMKLTTQGLQKAVLLLTDRIAGQATVVRDNPTYDDESFAHIIPPIGDETTSTGPEMPQARETPPTPPVKRGRFGRRDVTDHDDDDDGGTATAKSDALAGLGSQG